MISRRLGRRFSSQPLHFFSNNLNQFNPSPSSFKPLSDQEWEIRTGRGIYVLQQTLPTFFTTGLITSIDKSKLPDIVDGVKARKRRKPGSVVEGVQSLVGSRQSKINEESEFHVSEEDQLNGDIELLYSSKVQLIYTPEGFERSLHIEGAPLYIASSSFVRHTLNALYSDLKVDLLKMRVLNLPTSDTTTSSWKGRDKNLCLRIGVTGLARVSGTKSEWEVDCTYSFSPITGLILVHTVNSIQPAPHQSVYDAFRLGFGKLGLGFNGNNSTGRNSQVAPANACEEHGRVDSQETQRSK